MWYNDHAQNCIIPVRAEKRHWFQWRFSYARQTHRSHFWERNLYYRRYSLKALTPEKPKEQQPFEIGRHLYMAFLGLTALPCLSVHAFAAETTIWDKASEIMKDVYLDAQTLEIS